jgi:hypothetical protein
MFRDDPRFAPYGDGRWEDWRRVEADSEVTVVYCRACGFTHRIGNHAPARLPLFGDLFTTSTGEGARL